MKTWRLGRFLAILFAVRGAERVYLQGDLPAGLLLHAVEGAQVIPPGANSPATRAQTGTLLFYGSRVLSGEHPVSFVLYPQKSKETVYTFSPLFGSLPLRNFDPKKRSAEYEVQIDPEGVIPHYGRLETRTDLPEPLLLPNPGLVARNPSPGPESLLIARIDAALRSVSSPDNEALLRISRAAALERLNLEEARREYQRVAAVWKDASWITSQKLPALERQIRIEERKALLARNPGRTLALLVGISDYRYSSNAIPASRIPSVPFAERDIDSLRVHFQGPRGGNLPPSAITSLPGPKATVAAIRNGIRNLLENQAGPQDTVLIFLSGQGFAESASTGSRGFFMAWDSDPQDKNSSAYSLQEMSETIRSNISRVKRIYLLADLCRVPGVPSEPNTINALFKAGLENMRGEMEVVLSSGADAKPVQISGVDSNLDGGHGIFSYYLVKGLEGAADSNRDGKVTADEIYTYVSEQVARATNGAQRPVHFGRLSPDAPLSLLAAAASPIPRARPEPVLLAFAGRLRTGLLAFAQAATPQAASPQTPAAPASDDATALADEGQRILVQYLSGEETPPARTDFERGADLFRQAYALDPSPEWLARMLFFRGRSAAFRSDATAVPDLQAALELEPDGAYAYNALGIALLQRAAFTDAAGAFRDAIGRAPHWVYPHYNLGLTYAEAGVYDAAEREYRQAVRMEPGYSYVHYGLAMLLQKLGRKKDAEHEYREAIQRNPAHPEPYIGLGTVLAASGKRTEAERNYRTAMGLNPEVPAAAHNLGLLLAKNKQPDAAIKIWEDNVRLNPQFVPSRMSLAKAYVTKARFDEAIAQYQSVLGASPNYTAAEMALHETLGDRYRQQSQVEQARTEYRLARPLAVASSDRKRIDRKLR